MSVVPNFISSLNIPSEFAFLMLLEINSHFVEANEGMLYVFRSTLYGFSVFAVLDDFLNCIGFV